VVAEEVVFRGGWLFAGGRFPVGGGVFVAVGRGLGIGGGYAGPGLLLQLSAGGRVDFAHTIKLRTRNTKTPSPKKTKPAPNVEESSESGSVLEATALCRETASHRLRGVFEINVFSKNPVAGNLPCTGSS